MFSTHQKQNVAVDAVPEKQIERPIRLRIEQLEARIAPRCIPIIKDIMSPK